MKNRSLVLVALVGLAGASALSCASQSAATTAPADSSTAAAPAGSSTEAPAAAQQAPQAQAAEAPVAGPPQVAWKDMTKQQRGKYMGMVVVPKMKPLFQAFDPKEFAEFGCKTCHGEKARDRGFEMPNPELPELSADPAAFGALMKDKPEMMQFMSQKVKPEMAALLGVKEYDPQNPQPGTFGCNNCHTFKAK